MSAQFPFTGSSMKLPATLIAMILLCPLASFGAGSVPATKLPRPTHRRKASICRESHDKFCAGLPSPSPAAATCMHSHLAELTPECRERVLGNGPCFEISKTLCTEFKGKLRESNDCFFAHKAQLNVGCLAYVERSRKLWDVCKDPIQKYCQVLPSLSHPKCLNKYRESLTGECAAMLDPAQQTKPALPPKVAGAPGATGAPTAPAVPEKVVSLPTGLAIPGARPPTPIAPKPGTAPSPVTSPAPAPAPSAPAPGAPAGK